MRQRECLIVVLLSLLMVGCHGTERNGGTGDALRVTFAEAAKSPDARTLPANHEVADPGDESAAPSRPTTGTRKQAADSGRDCGFVDVVLPSFPAHSMASPKARSVRHRTRTPLSAPATSSRLSTTRSRSQTGWVRCCVGARSLCSAF